MMKQETGHELIIELLKNPAKFSKQGKPYNLLQEYFKGFDIETLRPLLQSSDKYIQSTATFIVSELGKDASPLIEDLIPLLNSNNLSVKYEALESIMLCSLVDNVEKFVYVIRAMEDKDDVIRIRAMELISNANYQQIQAAIQMFGTGPDNIDKFHVEGLTLLLKSESVTPEKIGEMLKSEYPIVRKYGAILAKQIFQRFPDLIKEGLANEDFDIQHFSEEFIDEVNL